MQKLLYPNKTYFTVVKVFTMGNSYATAFKGFLDIQVQYRVAGIHLCIDETLQKIRDCLVIDISSTVRSAVLLGCERNNNNNNNDGDIKTILCSVPACASQSVQCCFISMQIALCGCMRLRVREYMYVFASQRGPAYTDK